MPADINMLLPQKSLIDLSALPKNSFNSVFYGYKLRTILDDVLLVEYADESNDGTTIQRRGLHIPINADTKAWRIGKVILAGNGVKITKVGDYVLFPHNLGIPVSDIDVAGSGTLGKGIFLNEQRIFGICEIDKSNDESVASILTNSSAA